MGKIIAFILFIFMGAFLYSWGYIRQQKIRQLKHYQKEHPELLNSNSKKSKK